MIEKPEIGMRVFVDDPTHCFEDQPFDNHGGPGVITSVADSDWFEVKMDEYPGEEWIRCRKCVSELDKGATNEQ